MAVGSVSPSPECSYYDLDAASNSKACSEIRQALDVLGSSATTTGRTATLDAPTNQQLRPFATMFQFQRIITPYHVGHVLLVLYAPFGALLLLLRGFMLYLVALVLPRLFTGEQLDRMGIHKLFCIITGTIVHVEDRHLLDDNAEILVANHISEFDALALRSLKPSYLLGYDFYKKMLFFRLMGDTLGLVYVPYVSRNQGGADGRDRVRQLVIEKLERKDKPLAAFPEGGLTNGRKGLLQYHKFLFSLGKTVQPLAIQASDGPFPININDETSTFMANVLWYIFVPWHHYTIKCLPSTQAHANEDALDFAQRVMRSTADALHHQATPFLYRDKIAFTRYTTQQLNKKKK